MHVRAICMLELHGTRYKKILARCCCCLSSSATIWTLFSYSECHVVQELIVIQLDVAYTDFQKVFDGVLIRS